MKINQAQAYYTALNITYYNLSYILPIENEKTFKLEKMYE